MVSSLAILALSLTVIRPSEALGGVLVPPRYGAPRAQVLSSPLLHSANGTIEILAAYSMAHYFNRLIDHENLALGTFKQRNYLAYEFHKRNEPIRFERAGRIGYDELL
ncbi:hypothetical protein BDV93DRAFT_506018 [Ceratobasidium sp. AG-I]|nr:hypothetical protein BDV93DRAFT_506018 [Ceratobasidium sp. AG-I]